MSHSRHHHFVCGLPALACESFSHGQSNAGLNKLRVFQQKTRVQLARSHPALAAQLNDLAQQTMDGVKGDSNHCSE